MKFTSLVAALAALAFSAAAQAQGTKGMDMKGMSHDNMHVAQKTDSHDASGTVTKVDPAKGKVTIKHGPVASLKWPGMTMGFDVKDKALYDKLKPGEKVQFSFVESGKGYLITTVK